MKMNFRKSICIVACLCASVFQVYSQTGAYYTGVYRNMFKEYLNKTDAEVQTKINGIWDHFFVNSTNKVYTEVGTDMAYIFDTGNSDVRTEGMSYGMMICVQLDKKAQFDRIWKWAKTYMQYGTSSSYNGYFAWQCNTDGTIKGNSPASDGEAYFVTALFFAAHRWGNGTGIYNYEAEAQDIIAKIMNKTGSGSVYPYFNTTSNLVTFVPYGDSYTYSDPSYNLPAFFELWAKWSTSNQAALAKTPAAARTLLKNASNTTSGLFPDYCSFSGAPYNPSWKTDYDAKQYKYDAIRCAMNVGMDYNWFRSDSVNQVSMMTKLLTFFQSDGFAHGYFDWNGTNSSGSYSEGMAGANGVGAFAVSSTLGNTYTQRLWNVSPPTGTYRYYNGMVYFLSMLHASGNFKIYQPPVTGFPVVSLTSPTTTTFTTPATVTISATATDANGSIASVAFYNGSTLLTTVTTAPYTYTWANVPAGSDTITAVATDNSGNKTTSSPIVIKVTAPALTGTITISAKGVAGTESINLEVDGTIIKTWTLTTDYADYTATANVNGVIRVNYTNDATGMDAQVDYIVVAGTTYQAEDQAINTGYYANGSCGGGSNSEMMHCSGYIQFATTPISAIVNAPTVVSPVTYCQNVTATTLTATGTALKWYTTSSGGTALASAPVPSTTTTGSTSYYVSQTVGTTESPRAAIVVSITATPAAPTVTATVNYVQLATASALSATGTGLNWYTVAIGGTASTAAPTPITTSEGTTIYYVSQTLNTCESPRSSISVVVSPAQSVSLNAGWNFIGCPISGSTAIENALASIWTNVEIVKNMDAFYSYANTPALNSLKTVNWGTGYFVKVTNPCVLDWIVK